MIHTQDKTVLFEPYPDSYYAATVPPPEVLPSLNQPVRTQVCVVGGGLTGLSTAIHLAQRGVDVVLLEANRIGWGASGRNGGHCAAGQRWDQGELEKRVGETQARQLWALSLEAVTLVSALITRWQIQCDLKTGILQLAQHSADAHYYQKYVQLLCTQYQYPVEFIEGERLVKLCGTRRFVGGLLDRSGLHLHPLKYTLGLAQAARSLGVKLFENTCVTAIDRQLPLTVNTTRAQVQADYVVLACNGYLNQLEPRLVSRIMPINNFMLATAPLSQEQKNQINPKDWAMHDARFVVNYWKLSADGRMLFGGGENYGHRFPKDIKAFVRPYLLNIYPQLKGIPIDYAWGGTLAVTRTRLPSIGTLSPQMFYAQGFSGHGVPTATLAGKLIAEVISGETQRFDLMASLPVGHFPGGALMRWPLLVLGMLYYSLRDRLKF